ncbi:MAG: polysaccharide pyruvyl transferase family protein [Verrucomicrobiales bacterium]|jgi:hypothetical protein|nr:polysaccharide pyruvyl transferase family protein [Verrucomicrobiales bacterium]
MQTPFYYYDRDTNFGDLANPLLMERVFGLPVVHASKYRAALCGVGSVLKHFICRRGNLVKRLRGTLTAECVVWSAGFIAAPPPGRIFFRAMNFQALRGKLSRGHAERITGTRLDVPLGDGGLLYPLLLERRPPVTHAVGLIPHVSERDLPVFAALRARIPRSTLIDLRAEPLTVLRQIAACETILSSALHGLIAADGLGIPNRRLIVSDRLIGGDFKFNDYYSVYTLSAPPAPIRLNEDNLAAAGDFFATISDDYQIAPTEVLKIQETLRAVFVHRILPSFR